jgi:5-methylcytosine-specific restriction protein A
MPMAPQKHRAIAAVPVDRRSASARGYGRRWQKYRLAFLHRAANALCVECRKTGRITAATVVDHIIPHKGNDRLFWDPTNHQPLCATCHNKKTVREDGGFGHARTKT